MTKRIAMLAVLGLVAASLVLPSTTAQAATGAALGTCSTTLPLWPTTSPQSAPDCTGTAFGAGLAGTTPVNCLTGCPFRATVESYSEPCVADAPPPVGFASGQLYVTSGSEHNFGGYNWTRVGLTAIVLPTDADDAAGVAVFVPSIPLPSCGDARSLSVTVAGALVSAL